MQRKFNIWVSTILNIAKYSSISAFYWIQSSNKFDDKWVQLKFSVSVSKFRFCRLFDFGPFGPKLQSTLVDLAYSHGVNVSIKKSCLFLFITTTKCSPNINPLFLFFDWPCERLTFYLSTLTNKNFCKPMRIIQVLTQHLAREF